MQRSVSKVDRVLDDADSPYCANAAKPGDRAVDAFIQAEGISLASDGTMYLTDDGANRVWHVNAAGILEVAAGNGTTQPNGDGIAATSAGIVPSGDVKVGPDNSVYFADVAVGQRIRRIDQNGTITTVAGTGVCGSLELTRFRGRLTRPNFGVEVVHESQQEGRISGTARAA